MRRHRLMAMARSRRSVSVSRQLAEEPARTGDAQRSRERLRVLTKATQAFSEASGSLERLFQALVREIAETLECACALGLLTDDGAHFTTAHVHAADPELLAAFRAHLTAGGARRIDAHPGLRHVVETRMPFFVPQLDASSDPISARAAPDVLHFARDDEQFGRMADGLWRVLKPGGLLFARLASDIGIETQVHRIAGRRFRLPDGSDRYLVDAAMLRGLTQRLGGRLLDPLKTTVVQDQRSMTTWVVRK